MLFQRELTSTGSLDKAQFWQVVEIGSQRFEYRLEACSHFEIWEALRLVERADTDNDSALKTFKDQRNHEEWAD